jgi:ribosomal protein S18 acetylase RimI-like enzyme
MITTSLQVRSAVFKDQQQIANLMYFESHVHRHLDWRAPLDWLGSPNFWVLEDNQHIVGTLACPKDSHQVAWVRLFAHADRIPMFEAWKTLWDVAEFEIAKNNGGTVAAIAIQKWMQRILETSDFINSQEIVMFQWHNGPMMRLPLPKGISLRLMTPEDLPGVAELDSASFNPLWQNPLEALMKAFPQAHIATVMEDDQGLVGYQITTENPLGAHLARLAIRPDAQKRGLGSTLVADLLKRLDKMMIRRLSVNTQNDNIGSMALYSKMGFVKTGEQYPVYRYDIQPQK